MSTHHSPLYELTLARLRQFFREPGAVFWTFGFPLVLSLALGLAFRNKPPDPISVAVEDGPQAERIAAVLATRTDIHARRMSEGDAHQALRTGKVALVITSAEPRVYTFDRMRPDSKVARAVIDDVLQVAEGRKDPTTVTDRQIDEPGGRYIDFLIPGLLGTNLMQSGLWGLGFAIVEMRTQKLLKRLVATPMNRAQFLLSFIIMRLVFLLLELPVLLGFGWLAFGVTVHGSWLLLLGISILGAIAFSGIGLLVGSRAQNTTTAGGLMNLVMMPMFLLSGVFFSSANFPDVLQPFIKLLPLTALNDSLRAVMNDGAGLSAVLAPMGVLVAFSVVSFATALRIFRWQ